MRPPRVVRRREPATVGDGWRLFWQVFTGAPWRVWLGWLLGFLLLDLVGDAGMAAVWWAAGRW